jgi:hypothetical protein
MKRKVLKKALFEFCKGFDPKISEKFTNGVVDCTIPNMRDFNKIYTPTEILGYSVFTFEDGEILDLPVQKLNVLLRSGVFMCTIDTCNRYTLEKNQLYESCDVYFDETSEKFVLVYSMLHIDEDFDHKIKISITYREKIKHLKSLDVSHFLECFSSQIGAELEDFRLCID